MKRELWDDRPIGLRERRFEKVGEIERELTDPKQGVCQFRAKRWMAASTTRMEHRAVFLTYPSPGQPRAIVSRRPVPSKVTCTVTPYRCWLPTSKREAVGATPGCDERQPANPSKSSAAQLAVGRILVSRSCQGRLLSLRAAASHAEPERQSALQASAQTGAPCSPLPRETPVASALGKETVPSARIRRPDQWFASAERLAHLAIVPLSLRLSLPLVWRTLLYCRCGSKAKPTTGREIGRMRIESGAVQDLPAAINRAEAGSLDPFILYPQALRLLALSSCELSPVDRLTHLQTGWRRLSCNHDVPPMGGISPSAVSPARHPVRSKRPEFPIRTWQSRRTTRLPGTLTISLNCVLTLTAQVANERRCTRSVFPRAENHSSKRLCRPLTIGRPASRVIAPTPLPWIGSACAPKYARNVARNWKLPSEHRHNRCGAEPSGVEEKAKPHWCSQQPEFRIADPVPSYKHTNTLLLCVAVLCCCACAFFPPTWGPFGSFRRPSGTYRCKACAHDCPTPPSLGARIGITARPRYLLTTRPDLKRKRVLVLLNARRDQLVAAALQESSPQQMRCSQAVFRRTCRIRLTGGRGPVNLVPKGIQTADAGTTS